MKTKNLKNDLRRNTNNLIEKGKKITHDALKDAKKTADSANELLNEGIDKIALKTKKVKRALKD